MTKEPLYKRRRVSRACESCRALKAKCHGKQPICARCSGYERICRWKDGSESTSSVSSGSPNSESLSVSKVERLREVIRDYDQLVRGFRARLSDQDRKIMDLGLSKIRHNFPEATPSDGLPVTSPLETTNSLSSPISQRYFGEASDIRFYNAIKQVLYDSSTDNDIPDANPNRDVVNYEQELLPRLSTPDEENGPLPTKEAAEKYLEIYFSTIHIAYPFVDRKALLEKHQKFWSGDSSESLRGPSMSLLLTIFAIGASYESFSDPDPGVNNAQASQHHRYFDQAVRLFEESEAGNSTDHICILLAQCFYFLATSQAKRCWITLGLVVRTAQSMGLHVEDPTKSVETEKESRRRVWYSIYVLDRLLALQMGRPPAIHEGDFKVSIPSPRDTDYVDSTNDLPSPSSIESGLIGEYFIVMIQFSQIIGRVLRSLYSPTKIDLIESSLATTEILDQDLLQWKARLPRVLRFDLAHTFEKSLIFKRQRNMLAIKFYHLRALIHRPQLSLATVNSSSLNSMHFLDSERGRIQLSRRICVSSAQNTAKLLHNVDDKKSLIYEFPWWQMISCLICASSILLVAGICTDHDQDRDPKELDRAAIEEDAEVCLTVFQALGSGSKVAKIARDMMQGLKETRLHVQSNSTITQQNSQPQNHPRSPISEPSAVPVDTLPSHDNFLTNSYDFDVHQMAYQVSEPIMWSAQFVDAAYNPFLSRASNFFKEGT